MSAINAQNLAVSFGEKTLFENISFEIGENDKIALMGVNGAGKTTLLNIITGQFKNYSGNVFKSKTTKIGYMQQHSLQGTTKTVFDELLSTFDYLIQMEKSIENLLCQIEQNSGSSISQIKELDALQNEYHRLDGLTYVNRTKSALLGLGFDEEQINMPASQLSGGQKSKLELAKLLLSKADFLVLDEPTNHLDITATKWLEDFLCDFKGGILLISHDRYFVDKIVKKTMEIKNGKLMLYTGNYTEFLKKKASEQQAIEDKYKNDLKEIKRLEAIVKQQRQWNREKNIVTAESKLKVIERIKAQLVLPEKELEKIRFNFDVKLVSGNDVLFCQNLAKSFGDKQIFSGVNMHITKGERVFLLGANGCGKTTLLKTLMSQYPPSSGTFSFGANVKLGYFAQTHDTLHGGKTVLREVWDDFPALPEHSLRSALAAFLFFGDDVYKTVAKLSGGEKARVALLKLMLGGFNFLLLDEPTNHLDSFSREELEQTLLQYPGTMLIVSHDRYFVNKLATRVLDMQQNSLVEYLGNYDFYIEKKAQLAPVNSNTAAGGTNAVKVKNSYHLKKELSSATRKQKNKLQSLEADIEALEKSIAKTEEVLAMPETAADYQKLLECTQAIDKASAELDELYITWEMENEELQAQLEKLEALV